MENLKIKVNTPEESERAQKAFFALGYKWFGHKYNTPQNTNEKFLIADKSGELDYVKSEKSFSCNWWDGEDFAKEITLPDLEALAQKAQTGEGLNSFEAMVGERPTQAENLADRYIETNPVIFVYQKDGTTKALSFKEAKQDASELINAGWAHIATLDAKVFVEHHYGQESESQGRYEAALGYLLKSKNDSLINTSGEVYMDFEDEIKQALRIAAGLEAS